MVTHKTDYRKWVAYIKRQAAKGSAMHQIMLDRYNELRAQGVDVRTAVKKAKYRGTRHRAHELYGNDIRKKGTRGAKVVGHALTKTQDPQDLYYYSKPVPILSRLKKAASSVRKRFVREMPEPDPELDEWADRKTVQRVQRETLRKYREATKPPPTDEELASRGEAFWNLAERDLKRARRKEKIFSKAPGILTSDMGQRIKYKIYNMMFFAVIGLICYFVPPFFGLPSFPLLGNAFFTYAAVQIFPTEREAKLAILRKWGDEGVTVTIDGLSDLWDLEKGPYIGGLLVRSLVKIVAFGFAIAQFLGINRFIALTIGFIFYSSLATRYKTDELYKVVEAWTRPIMGGVLAWLFFVTFGSNNVGFALASMGAAFFITFPVLIPGDKEKKESPKRGFGDLHESWLDKLMFAGLMFFSLLYSGILTGIMSGSEATVFGIIWLISFIGGWNSGPGGRPALGIMMIMISLFAFSFTYTGIMGQAIFGYWWPQVYGGIQFVGDTLGPMWEQAQGGIGDTWMLMTNPAGYYDMMMRRQQASTTRVKTGGSISSIELSMFNLFTSTEGFIDPMYDPVVGYIELENRGEFDADRIFLKIQPAWVNPERLTEVGIGTFEELECSSPIDKDDIIKDVGIGTCEWKDVTLPKELKLVSFVIKEGEWGNLMECENFDKEQDMECDDDETYYKHANEMVKFNAIYNYDYNVNVSIETEIINSDLYFDLLKSREIILKELTSQYTGGPVKATIWSQRQPIRAGDTSLFVFSVYNDGSGKMNQVKDAMIRIPEIIGTVKKVSSTFKIGTAVCEQKSISCGLYDDGNDCENVDGCIWDGVAFDDPAGTCTMISASCDSYGEEECDSASVCKWVIDVESDGCDDDFEPDGEFYTLNCEHTIPIKRGDFVRLSFFLTPNKDLTEQKITSLLTGFATYEYEETESQTLTIANSPLH